MDEGLTHIFFWFWHYFLFLSFDQNVAEFLGGDIFHWLNFRLVRMIADLLGCPKYNRDQATGDSREISEERTKSHVSCEVLSEEGQSHRWNNDTGEDIDAIYVLREGLDIPAEWPVGPDDEHDQHHTIVEEEGRDCAVRGDD